MCGRLYDDARGSWEPRLSFFFSFFIFFFWGGDIYQKNYKGEYCIQVSNPQSNLSDTTHPLTQGNRLLYSQHLRSLWETEPRLQCPYYIKNTDRPGEYSKGCTQSTSSTDLGREDSSDTTNKGPNVNKGSPDYTDLTHTQLLWT